MSYATENLINFFFSLVFFFKFIFFGFRTADHLLEELSFYESINHTIPNYT